MVVSRAAEASAIRLGSLRTSSSSSRFCSKRWSKRERNRRERARTNVWREISDHVSAVVDAKGIFLCEEEEEEREEEEEGLGPSDPAVALESYLRIESSKQRDAMRMDNDALRRFHLSLDEEDDIREAVEALERDGVVVLSDTVEEEACDGLMKEVRSILRDARKMYGKHLRRTDVLVAYEGSGRACLRSSARMARKILSRVENATEEATLVEMSVLATEDGAERQMLHPDMAFDAPHETLYSMFVALQDVTLDMGPTCFLLRSQDENTHLKIPSTQWDEEEYDFMRTKSAADATLKKGDAVLYDARTFHQGGANRSGKTRALLAFTFLKPPIPVKPMRRNKVVAWSIRDELFDLRLNLCTLAADDD